MPRKAALTANFLLDSMSPVVSDAKGTHVSFYIAFEAAVRPLPRRSQEILRARFGVGAPGPQTLDAIGKKYTITRERVRQIVRTNIDSIKMQPQHAFIDAAHARIEYTLSAHSGIIKEKEILYLLGGHNAKEIGAVRFFLAYHDAVRILASAECERSYVHGDFDDGQWRKVVKLVRTIFRQEKMPLLADALAARVRSEDARIMQKMLFDYIAPLTDIRQSPFGRWGFAQWSDVTPKGIREKVYLILKELGQPMHFREIAAQIDVYQLNKNGRQTHPQTVHNELIKDTRCVLIGRGTYALCEWGYAPGTVRDVIADVLKKNRTPLSVSDITTAVLAVRRVKKSTILVNLNTFFRRVDGDAYTLKMTK